MPYQIKLTGYNNYDVINSITKKLHSSHPTLEKAQNTIRILYSKEK